MPLPSKHLDRSCTTCFPFLVPFNKRVNNGAFKDFQYKKDHFENHEKSKSNYELLARSKYFQNWGKV